MTTERSLVLVKPDGFRRGLTGEVLRRIEAKGYTRVSLAVLTVDSLRHLPRRPSPLSRSSTLRLSHRSRCVT